MVFCQVTNLKPDTSYVFLVRARNIQGFSLPGPLSDVARTTGLDQQQAIPQTELIRARDRLNSEILYLKQVEALSSTSVKIIWDVSTYPIDTCVHSTRYNRQMRVGIVVCANSVAFVNSRISVFFRSSELPIWSKVCI